jgi:phosphohistidine phosphatase
MELILIRHAKAFERDALKWPDDSRRPLTEEGVRDFRRLAKRLGRLVPAVELVESSAFERAWATAEILRDRAGWPKPRRSERLEPGGGEGLSREGPSREGPSREGLSHEGLWRERMQALARTIASMHGLRTVVWVGHEPMFSCLASFLLTGSIDAMKIDFAKGAALALRFQPPVDTAAPPEASSVVGRAQMMWMLTPRMVRRMR